jgi:hypothetical protein
MQYNAAPSAAAAPPAAGAAASDLSEPAAASRAPGAFRLKAESADRRAALVHPETALERIAQLRAEGHDDEADRALEAFRRDYPAFRMSDAQWDRVRRRAP